MRLVRHEHESGCGHEQRVGDRDGPFMRAAEQHRDIHDCHADETAGDEFRREMRFQRATDQRCGNRADYRTRQQNQRRNHTGMTHAALQQNRQQEIDTQHTAG